MRNLSMELEGSNKAILCLGLKDIPCNYISVSHSTPLDDFFIQAFIDDEGVNFIYNKVKNILNEREHSDNIYMTKDKLIVDCESFYTSIYDVTTANEEILSEGCIYKGAINGSTCVYYAVEDDGIYITVVDIINAEISTNIKPELLENIKP